MLLSRVYYWMVTDNSIRSERRSDRDEGFVAVDDTRLRYRTAGRNGQTALVFVHAGVADSRLWARQMETFADRYHVITYDLRGYGDSELPPQSYAHYRDLESLLDSLHVGPAHFVGASMGGAVVVDFALLHPDRVRSLTLLTPAVSGYEFTDEATLVGWQRAAEAVETSDFERAAAIESEMWLAGPTRTLDDIDPECRELVRAMLERSYEHATDEAAEEQLNPPAIGRLDDLRPPVLLVSGELDRPDMAAIAARLTDELTDVRYEMVDDTAHLPSLERPDEFDRLLTAFLSDVDGDASDGVDHGIEPV